MIHQLINYNSGLTEYVLLTGQSGQLIKNHSRFPRLSLILQGGIICINARRASSTMLTTMVDSQIWASNE